MLGVEGISELGTAQPSFVQDTVKARHALNFHVAFVDLQEL